MMMVFPPGLSTRKISQTTWPVCGIWWITPLLYTTSKLRHVLRVPTDELALQPAHIEVFSRKRHMPFGEFQIGHDCAILCELGKVGSNPRANLQHALASMAVKLHEVRHPRPVLVIAVFLDSLEESEAILALGDILRAARIGVPLLLSLPLVRIERKPVVCFRSYTPNSLKVRENSLRFVAGRIPMEA